MSNPDSLESKLKDLLSALNANGNDNWENKPTQIPLTELIGTDTNHNGETKIEIVQTTKKETNSNGNNDSLDALLSQYVENVKKVRQIDDHRDGTASDTIEDKSIAQLLEDLDNLPPLK
ncbi:hypothetical protein AGDE_10062 [Angomonas deanei]|nr:hypothetical protein AGDE_10062 [Angomonas deanei]|eukprot:EPY29226.1 hypothetical protein AGDE_10062 [Angomonas deanei]